MLLIPVIRQILISVPIGYSAEDARIGEQKVEDQLRVKSPISGVVEDEDRVNLET